MKVGISRKIGVFLAAWFVLSVAVGGGACVFRAYNVSKPNPVVVATMPPAPKAEHVPTQPSQAHIWTKGAWQWDETTHAWEWKAGSWVVPPSRYTWADPTYEKQGDNTVVYTPGHWEEIPVDPPVKDMAAQRKPHKQAGESSGREGCLEKRCSKE